MFHFYFSGVIANEIGGIMIKQIIAQAPQNHLQVPHPSHKQGSFTPNDCDGVVEFAESESREILLVYIRLDLDLHHHRNYLNPIEMMQ